MIRSFLFAGWIVSCTIVSGNYHTCAEWMAGNEKNALSDGIYNISTSIDRTDDTDLWREVYCVFDYTRDYGWTLFESGSRSTYSSTLNIGFITDGGYNEDDVGTYKNSLYRLSREWMFALYFVSDYLFATCEFDTSFSQDWLLLDLNSLDNNPFFDTFSGYCTTAISANIRGYLCQDSTVKLWVASSTHLHIDSSSTGCDCSAWATGSSSSEDNFGLYTVQNTEFTCTASSSATTNWWFGSDVTSYKTPTQSPTSMPSSDPTKMPTNEPTLKPSAMPSNEPSGEPTNGPSNDPTQSPSAPPTIFTVNCTQCSLQCDDASSEAATTTDEDGEGSNAQSNNGSSSSDDGLSTEFIIIIIVVSVLGVLFCIFCLLFTGVISYHARKHEQRQHAKNEHLMQLATVNNKGSNNNDNNGQLLQHVASTSSMRQTFETGASPLSTGGDGDGNPNGNGDGPNITWQELAQIHALTTRAMNTMNNAGKIGQPNALLGGSNNGPGSSKNALIDGDGGNGAPKNGQSQVNFGENENGPDIEESDDNQQNALSIAMDVAFNDDQAAKGQNNQLLAEGGAN